MPRYALNPRPQTLNPKPQPVAKVHYNMQRQTDHRDAGILNNYKVTFTKRLGQHELQIVGFRGL